MTSSVAEGAVGHGLYTMSEAVGLTAVPASRIRRYLCGYSYRRGGERRVSGPIFEADYRPTHGVIVLSFRDLIEVRFVDAFRRHGVGPPEIRRASMVAARRWHLAHPFSARRFRTDGREIFEEVLRDEHGEELIHLAREQRVFYDVIAPSLHGLEFDKDVVVRWFPLGSEVPVVVDPRRALGKPISAHSGVPTALLAQAAAALGNSEAVAEWYGVGVDEVEAAVGFEARSAA